MVLFLAYVNGANDNFKGLATLYGSKTVSYKKALAWATVTTLLGSLLSIIISKALLISFSGKGLVPDAILSNQPFILAIAIGAGLTVLIATITGLPISTTHSLIGAIIGSGLMAGSSTVNLSRLSSVLIMPLLLSPFIAFALSKLLYKIFHSIQLKYKIEKTSCLCVEKSTFQFAPIMERGNIVQGRSITASHILIDEIEKCDNIYSGNIFGISFQKLIDKSHFISSGVVSFARGLNDTPKITALLVITQLFKINYGLLFVAVAMAIGGIINARKVAETMSNKITHLNSGQGFTANITTSLLVLFASSLGLPVSTTHVSTAAVFGIVTKASKENKRTIINILLSWILTLPLAASISAVFYNFLK